MKRTDLAYVAGIIDGEGTIGLNTCKDNCYRLIVEVANTNEWLIQWLHLAFGGRVYSPKSHKGDNWKPLYLWKISSTDALEVLELVYPYLRLKKPQAEIAIKFLKMKGYKGRWLTDEEKAVAEAQRIVMSNLNKRGLK